MGLGIKSKLKKIHKFNKNALAVCKRRIVYSSGEVQNNKVFIMTYDNAYSCNPKYIAQELLKRNENLDIVWAGPADGSPSIFPEGIRSVPRGTKEMFEEQASSKVWIDNALNCVWYGLPKKKEQVYINTWHGSMGIKRLSGNRIWKLRAKRCNKLTNYCITNSKFEEDVFNTEFWPDVEFKKFGHARNDIFFNEELCRDVKQKVLDFYNIESDKKIFLYAPTFRDDGKEGFFNLDFNQIIEKLEGKFGGEWIVLVRLHFKDRAKADKITFDSRILDGGKYPDMQELMAAIDMGMTDYSSWAYDYILTRRPMFIYAPDLADYEGGRGFYYPIETTPFAIAKDNEDVLREIDSFDDDDYQKKVDAFLEDKGCYESGEAAKKTADLILSVVKG